MEAYTSILMIPIEVGIQVKDMEIISRRSLVLIWKTPLPCRCASRFPWMLLKRGYHLLDRNIPCQEMWQHTNTGFLFDPHLKTWRISLG